MNTTEKNKWIAIVIALIAVGIALGGYSLYQNSMGPTVVSAPDTNQAATSAALTAQATTTTNMNEPTTLPDGLIIQDEQIGTGPAAKAGDQLEMNYVGTLEDGTKFDSSYDRNQPLPFTLGVGQVIKGWDEGVVGMKVGGKRKLIIPPALGYGNQAVPTSTGTIPANSTLIFEIELVSIK